MFPSLGGPPPPLDVRLPRWSTGIATDPTRLPQQFLGRLGPPARSSPLPGPILSFGCIFSWAPSPELQRGGTARTVAEAWDTVRYPLMIQMAFTLCNLSRMLRRLSIRSSPHTWAPYITRDRTTPLYSRRTATPAPPMFGSRPHKALAAADTLGIRES